MHCGSRESPSTRRPSRAAPPAALGGRAVLIAEDLAAGSVDDAAGLPPTDAVRYRLADGARVVVRPSGTEPKLKAYLEVVAPVAFRGDLPAVRAAAHRDLARIKSDLATLVSSPS